jgi:D-glycero-alpha-D-manno-heptose-7-phosphate kinase
MLISRTPYRISFFGGGTDYPAWYLKHGGNVLAATINKYCYLTCRYLPPFFEHHLRVVYSKIESVKRYNDIQHPAVRETLRFLNFEKGVEIHHDGDLPARSGMGSSSAFTVGLLNALYALKGYMPNRKQLALESIHIEQNLIRETVGSQDQISAAYGGLNHIKFLLENDFKIHPITVASDRLQELACHLMLFYTGVKRTASDVAKSYVDHVEERYELLIRMGQMVEEGISILNSRDDVKRFGHLLDEAWQFKRCLSTKVSNGFVDDLYALAKARGALGGKILGAGGGGFLLLFVPPHRQGGLREALSKLIHVPFNFESAGSKIIFYEPQTEDYTVCETDRAQHTIQSFRELNIDDITETHTSYKYPNGRKEAVI